MKESALLNLLTLLTETRVAGKECEVGAVHKETKDDVDEANILVEFLRCEDVLDADFGVSRGVARKVKLEDRGVVSEIRNQSTQVTVTRSAPRS
mmetsp:Transcript_2487/g.9631  ORF Transcript_2487/g.9631 Transcript_2487/m.9631 type:complete len:94 (-) Transcript_2487:579-860(-)